MTTALLKPTDAARFGGILLSADELVALTGYRRSSDQLDELHRQGFWRARLGRSGCAVLERAHYEAVCAGTAGVPERRPQLRTPSLNRRAGVRREEEPGTSAARVPTRPLVSADGRAGKQARTAQHFPDR